MSAQDSQTLEYQIKEAAHFFPGTVSAYARNIDTGADCGLEPDRRVRTASTIKLAIMAAVFTAVAEGRAKWNTRLKLREIDKVAGSGVLGEFGHGMKFPVLDLVHLMIVVSDNTATNLLLDRFTAEYVNQQMDRIGLTETRSLRKVRGDNPNTKTPSGWSRAGLIEENKRFGLGVSTPREMVTLLEKIERGQVVNEAASKQMIEILKRQQYKHGIGRQMESEVASKSGSLDALRSDAGIVYSKGGRIAIAVTVDDMAKTDYSPDNEGELLISRLAQMLVAGLSRG
ncbi:MAG: serine hydrolase [Bryobacteraceae bacterium]